MDEKGKKPETFMEYIEQFSPEIQVRVEQNTKVKKSWNGYH